MCDIFSSVITGDMHHALPNLACTLTGLALVAGVGLTGPDEAVGETYHYHNYIMYYTKCRRVGPVTDSAGEG